MTVALTPPELPPAGWRRRLDTLMARLRGLDPTTQGLLWSSAAGLVFSVLNT